MHGSCKTSAVARIVIAGGGVAGLGTALYLGRSGHRVVVVERDDTPLPPSPAEAFWWQRSGAPQVRHSHAFLARLHNQLRDDHPDLLVDLLRAGATEMDFISMLPEGMDRTPMPGDEDLVALACRRTTFEWVARHAALRAGAVQFRTGVSVEGLLTHDGRVCGAGLSDGTDEPAEIVVLAGGRRMDVPALYLGCGVELTEQTVDTGIIYLSRFYRLARGHELPPQLGPIGSDLGYLKYAVFPGDARTFSITLAVDHSDRELRRMLTDSEGFDSAARVLPATAAHLDGRAEPITGVEVMAGLINRRRHFTLDGEVVLPGVVCVGDAHTATNPIYGRGCSLAMVQAALLDDALREHPGDALWVCSHYEGRCDSEVLPWYRAAVAQDRLTDAAGTAAKRPSQTSEGEDGIDTAERARFVGEVMRDGLVPAMRIDPVVLRAFLAVFNLLRPPDSLLSDSDVVNRVMSVYAQRGERAPEPSLGPGRSELVDLLAGDRG